ncbi:MAG TPA: hypothetical protein VMY37_39750 [Thermoguttaceae bacterium]|nr:hypothetical protein [Thermoguttaceae bacterium]
MQVADSKDPSGEDTVMLLARYGIIALALAAMIGSVASAEEPAKTAGMQSTRMPGLPRIAYRSFWPQERYNRQFAEAGVKLVFIYPSNTICSLDVPYSNYPQIWTGPNQYNWKSLDDHVGDVLKWNSQAKLMVMIDLNTPAWWVESHDGADSFRQLAETVLRDDFKRDAKEYMRRFLEYTESKYQDKIVTYQLSCGGTCEWYDWQKGKPGPRKHAAFAQWMGRPGLRVSEDRERTSHDFFYDPVKDAEKIAYWKFHNRLIADAMLDFAAEAKRIIRNRVPLGTFHGYIMELGAHRLLYEGQLGYDRTFQSPLLGYNTEPADYANRRGGGTGGFLYCIDSLFANHKGAWHEVDHRTYCIKNSENIGTRRLTNNGKRLDLPTQPEAVGALRREFAMAMIHGSHLWWFDMFGGWFDDPVVMANMKKMTAISERFADTGPGKAEVAVLADADSMYYVDGHCRLADSLLRELQFAMFGSGVPWRCYSLADLPKLDMSPYQVVILPNLFVVTPEKRKLLEEKLFRDGKTIVMPFAPGIITDGTYDPANIEKLTGVKVEHVSRPTQPQEAVYKDRGQWTSVFLARPEMTSSLLREMFRKAGVHIYSEDGDPFYANDELIALHSAEGGKRTFRLPEARKVTELFEDRTVTDGPVTEFTETFKPMETRLYWLERN